MSSMHPAISIALWWITFVNCYVLFTMAFAMASRARDRVDPLELWCRVALFPALALVRIPGVGRLTAATWDAMSTLAERFWERVNPTSR